MPRTRMIAALTAAGIAAGALAAAAGAVPIPGDKGIVTDILMPMASTVNGAKGTATIQVDWKAHKVCYAIDHSGLSGDVKAAIVKGGTAVVDLPAQPRIGLSGCADVPAETAKAIVDSPADYAVSVNGGALSAKLGG